jgi:predicted phosphodiesterase
MKIAILSDIHANYCALKEVEADFRSKGISKIWFLGDVVGRGPNVIETMVWLEENVHKVDPNAWVIGNQDMMIANLLTQEEWNQVNDIPKEVIEKQRQEIKKDQETNEFLIKEFNYERSSPKTHQFNGSIHLLVHSSIIDYPGYDRYIFPWNTIHTLPTEIEILAKEQKEQGFPIVMWTGHTHIPTLISAKIDTKQPNNFEVEKVFPDKPYKLTPDRLWIVNPGSVGQPRDLDNRAAYAILDTDKHEVTFNRVAYDWRKTFKLMISKKYPQQLAKILGDATVPSDTPSDWRQHFIKARGNNHV